MFIRRVTYRVKPEYDTKEELQKLEEQLRGPFQDIAGLINSTFMPTSTKGEYQVVSVYQDEASAMAVTDKVRKEWAKVEDKLQGPVELEHYGTKLKDFY